VNTPISGKRAAPLGCLQAGSLDSLTTQNDRCPLGLHLRIRGETRGARGRACSPLIPPTPAILSSTFLLLTSRFEDDRCFGARRCGQNSFFLRKALFPIHLVTRLDLERVAEPSTAARRSSMGPRQSATTVRAIPVVRMHGWLGLRALVLALAASSAAGFSFSLAPPAPTALARLICTARPGGGGGGLWSDTAHEAPRWGRAGRAGLCRSLQMAGDGTGSIKSQQMMARLKALKVGRAPQPRTGVELHRLVRVPAASRGRFGGRHTCTWHAVSPA